MEKLIMEACVMEKGQCSWHTRLWVLRRDATRVGKLFTDAGYKVSFREPE
jgi:hypothetical protein